MNTRLPATTKNISRITIELGIVKHSNC